MPDMFITTEQNEEDMTEQKYHNTKNENTQYDIMLHLATTRVTVTRGRRR